ncbi:glycerate kinase [Bacillus salipaludis]|uniref:Glycerate kinase n=1 Tax=Bacillus salipaludis TaxID=2547811 RepID=A0A4R5VYV5_9BACI|nr:glycerate kinase [Bacillus salipaludis]MDQ6597058.1 glycerate kinase [Bacillus salipaludis]TDK64738.1 glycerate kinase [Bacillus salipaludis]
MKFVLAPDSFKESMTAKNAALAMEKGIKKVFPNAECVIVPMADGGEGTVESLVSLSNGEVIKAEVIGPLGKTVTAEYGLLDGGQTAVIEMASASGLGLIKLEERNPLLTTTYGTGQLIKHALDKGVSRFLIGIGGSATNDGGMGMLQALGVSFKDQGGKELPFGGGALDQLHSIDISGLDERLKTAKIDVACDVTNPLIGDNGASAIFGPQKGANSEMVKLLDQNLAYFAQVIKTQLQLDIAYIEGAGAAGGLGAGLLAFLNARLKKGIELVIEYTGLEEKIIGANYVFTGEGSIDGQTLFGKTPYGVAGVAKKHSVPVIAFAGRIGNGVEVLYNNGFNAIIGILKEVTPLEEALKSGQENLAFAAENICRVLKG